MSLPWVNFTMPMIGFYSNPFNTFNTFNSLFFGSGFNPFMPTMPFAPLFNFGAKMYDDFSLFSGILDLSTHKKTSTPQKRSIGTGIVSSVKSGAKKVLSLAAKYIGYNHSNGSYKLFTGGVSTTKWCAYFVSYILRKTGKGNFHYSAVSQYLDWAKQDKAKRLSHSPKSGQVIIFKGKNGDGKYWNAKKGRMCNISHTGFVEKVENGIVHTIEGNTTGQVARRKYSINDPRITCYVNVG